MYAPNIWPQQPHDFKPTMVAYYDAMMGLASRVLRAMALALGVEENYFADKFDRQASVCRMIRYPAVKEPPLPGQLRAGTHTDYGIMTFVRGDDTPGGLQVKHRNGSWIDVHIPPNEFVCNIGDLMMRWSNDRWVSTLHRVAMPPPGAAPSDRISLVFFTNPNPDAVIRCIDSCVKAGEMAKYPPVTTAEHYLGKLMKAGHSQLDATRRMPWRSPNRARRSRRSDRAGSPGVHHHAAIYEADGLRQGPGHEASPPSIPPAGRRRRRSARRPWRSMVANLSVAAGALHGRLSGG